jgi:hypothetical protein
MPQCVTRSKENAAYRHHESGRTAAEKPTGELPILKVQRNPSRGEGPINLVLCRQDLRHSRGWNDSHCRAFAKNEKKASAIDTKLAG